MNKNNSEDLKLTCVAGLPHMRPRTSTPNTNSWQNWKEETTSGSNLTIDQHSWRWKKQFGIKRVDQSADLTSKWQSRDETWRLISCFEVHVAILGSVLSSRKQLWTSTTSSTINFDITSAVLNFNRQELKQMWPRVIWFPCQVRRCTCVFRGQTTFCLQNVFWPKSQQLASVFRSIWSFGENETFLRTWRFWRCRRHL